MILIIDAEKLLSAESILTLEQKLLKTFPSFKNWSKSILGYGTQLGNQACQYLEKEKS